jgi:hypothetical protein
MRQRRVKRLTTAEWPPALRQLLRSAALECPEGHADALADLLALAVRKAPARGIFDPGARSENDLFVAIEGVARTRLGLAAAETEWRAALNASGLPLERRDAIERAAMQMQTASDSAYYYAGLSFGLAFVSVYRTDTG